jgi:hypothetical protein
MDADPPQTPRSREDLTSHAARRRRVLAGVLAGAAIAIPGVAFAAGGSSTDSTTAPPGGSPPAVTIQDDDSSGAQDRGRDGRDCPKEDGSGAGSGGDSSSGTSAEQTAL